MVGTYAVHWDTAANRVDFALAGSWDADVMDRWQAEFEASLVGARPGWTFVGDLTVYDPVQDATVARRQARFVPACRRRGMVRGALVVPRATAVWQAPRRHRASGPTTETVTELMITDETRAVTSREEALAFVEGR